MGLWDFFSHEAGQKRRNWLDSKLRGAGDALSYYIPPDARPHAAAALELGSMFNPVNDVGEAMSAGRDGRYGDMVLHTAIAASPAVAGRVAKGVNPRLVDDTAEWLEDALMGFSVNPTRAALSKTGQRFIVDETGAINLSAIRGKHPDAKIDVSGNPDRGYTIDRIVVPERGKGEGTAIMKSILQDADADGATVALTPSSDFGGNKARLKEFYKRFDFVENKGRNRDFEISEDMYRLPKQPALTPAQEQAQDVLDLLSAGRADEVTDDMLAKADDLYLFENYDLPMDEASRMARADVGWPDDAYHATKRDFDRFKPSNFRGASFFGPTPDGATRGASASANEGVGSGNGIIIPARVDTSGVEGLGSYARKDMNDFRASLDDRVYSEAEVDALMASDSAPLRGDWTYFFDDVTDYDALRAFMDSKPGEPIPDGIIGYKPAEPLRYSGELRRDNTGQQFAHYSDGMSEKPTSDYVISQGNTGFTMQDESGLALAITDPTTVRSRFARFDPRLKHLSNLSAAAAGIGLLAPAFYSEQGQ